MNDFFRTIKNFFEDNFLTLKNKFTSSRYVVKGKCRQCGQCCKNIVFSDENGYFKDEAEFLASQKRLKAYRIFKVSGKVDDEKDKAYGALTFECKYLKNGKCSIYFIRPLFCREYPIVIPDFIYHGGKTLTDCGFYFDVNKSFGEYIKEAENSKG